MRVQESQREARDAAVDALRKKYSAKQAQLAEQLRRAGAAVERETAQASQQKLQTGLSMGATLLGALFGRKTVSASTLGRATTAARGVGRSMKEAEDIKAAKENVEAVRGAAAGARRGDRRRDQQDRRRNAAPLPIEKLSLSPKRGQVSVQLVGLGWLPE